MEYTSSRVQIFILFRTRIVKVLCSNNKELNNDRPLIATETLIKRNDFFVKIRKKILKYLTLEIKSKQ